MNNKTKMILLFSTILGLGSLVSTQANNSRIIVVKPQDTKIILKLQAVPSEGNQPFLKGIDYEVFKIGNNGKRAKTSTQSSYGVGGVVYKGLKPGKYFIRARLSESNKIYTDITINLKKSQRAHYIFDMNVAALKLKINTATSTVVNHIYYKVETDNLQEDSRKTVYSETNNYHSDVRHITGRKPTLKISPVDGAHTIYLRPGKYRVSVGEYFRIKHNWVPFAKKDLIIILNKATQHTFNLNNKK